MRIFSYLEMHESVISCLLLVERNLFLMVAYGNIFIENNNNNNNKLT